MTFTLDTSGAVHGVIASDGDLAAYLWSDLSPFAQGYVEALFADFLAYDIGPNPHNFKAGFSDLHPEALAMVLRDEADARDTWGEIIMQWSAADGNAFYRHRSPPLTVRLDDAGKVVLS